MERTISGMVGKGSVNHNTRAFTAKNVDSDRSGANVHFCNEDIKQVYHKLFDEALERYNAKQKRKDRVIDDYYEKIRQGKQEKLFHEVIFQIGNKDDMNAKSEEGLLAKKILTEFMDEFQARNPNLYVFSAHLHMDEETPHLHIDFVPYITGSKRGLDTRVSLKSALAAEGFTGGTRGATEWNQWIAVEKQAMAMVMGRYGVKWLQKGTHEKHLSVLDFEKQERAKEVAELDSQKQEKNSEVDKLNQAVFSMKQELMTTTMKQVRAEEAVEKAIEEGIAVQRDNETLSASNQQLRVENTSLEMKKVELRTDNRHLEQQQWQLRTDNSELEMKQSVLQSENQRLEQEQNKLQEDNEKLEQKQTALQSDNQALKQMQDRLQKDNAQLEIQQEKLKSSINQMVQSEKLLQHDVRKYDEEPEWQLSEPGAFASAKSFRDKVALPLVNKLKELVKSLTIQCVRLKEEVLQLRDKVKHLTSDVEFYKGKIRDMSVKTELLQEKADDLERVKRYAGAEQINTIISKVKEQERMEQQARQYNRAYGAR
ncbi:plasmid recombination protein [Roseburia sp. AF20-18LB]|uniref:plasmid recombination protein n=1 Tax=Roseburia sp. AF20-18LB TaxID=2293129 RepID=UPI000E4B94EC|nr:plasmid recombination protein [Roseburia sp. AF20-18LB]RGG49946.1 recombinase [Roseburia sp. AF20-18LB]